MRVTNLERRSESRVVSLRGAESRESSETEQPNFRRTYNDMTQEAYTNRLLEKKRHIEEQAEILTKRVCVREYEKYRRLIREFLDEIVSNGYNFNREDAFSARGGRHRYIATVETINKELDELSKEILREQSDQIKVLQKIDEIRGLLVDLMM